MLIEILTTSGGFGPAIDYLVDAARHAGVAILGAIGLPSMLDHVVQNNSVAEVSRWKSEVEYLFEAQAIRSRSKKTAKGHVVISFHPRDSDIIFRNKSPTFDSLDVTMMKQIVRQVLDALNIKNTQVLAVAHLEKRHFHVHLLYNKVCNRGTRLGDWNNYYKCVSTQAEITHRYGFFVSDGKSESNLQALRGRRHAKYLCAFDAATALKEACSMSEFIEAMTHKGWTIVASPEEMNRGWIYVRRQKQPGDGLKLKKGETFEMPGYKIDHILAQDQLLQILAYNARKFEKDLEITDAEADELIERLNSIILDASLTRHELAAINEAAAKTAKNVRESPIIIAKTPQVIEIEGGMKSKQTSKIKFKNKIK